MKVKIGKLLPDGRVRHIEVFYEGESEKTVFLLKNFYRRETHLDALLDLGNLNKLNPSPYGKYRGYGDCIRCHSAVRDEGYSKKKHEAAVCDSREAFVKQAELCYLYENGGWSIHIGQRYSESIHFHALPGLIKWHPFSGLEIHESDKENVLSKVYAEFPDWKTLRAYAAKENKTLYVFRENRLVKTVNHPLKKETA
jgi:hypothetical protein